ncbi:MAG: MarR family transcriptional regulator [Sphingobacteriaceae bacterium]|nr:MAG: MarR family transcriptional regulator [Sphingobacteriaceae bacterium]
MKNQPIIDLDTIDTISDSFIYHVTRMHKAIVRNTTLLLPKASIRLQMEQLPILVILQKSSTLSQRELSDITHRDMASITRGVRSLLKKGLLAVKRDSVDKRKNKLF